MKKVMFALAALASCVAVADGIASANIVGYSTTSLTNGNKLVAAQFLPVGSAEGYDIQDIVASGDDVEAYVSLQTLKPSGKADETFSWDTWMYVKEGDAKWIDDEGIATRKFQPGEAIWTSGRAGYGIQTAGEVSTDDLVANLTDGNVAIGNPFPAAIDIQDIVATGDNVEGYVSLQTLTPSGKADETYSWDTWLYVEEGDAKWIDDKGIAVRSILPGEGLWISGKKGYTIRFPAPNYSGTAE